MSVFTWMQLYALKREIVSKEAVYLAVGIREDGSKEVLAYTIAPTKSAFFWKELLLDLKERGTEKVLLFISDGLKGNTDSIFSVYPDTQYQTCLVHLARTIAHKVRVTDRAEICGDFKAVYPKVTKALLQNPHIFTFYSFPKPIWRSLYSTNLIESFNKQIKKYTKRKEQFPHIVLDIYSEILNHQLTEIVE
ncbi:transposase IS905 [Jeotgalibacillus soli]|uniref:Mutator family transposase n=1 Tax=Jeotgalibacillus soli TaxID=889306 RepID=A0A0C2W1V5_9BACL|nr:transposase IS905 [Jeotgalibacillus soli]